MPISPLDPHANRLESPGYNATGANGNYTRKILDRTGAGLGEAHATIAAAKRLTRTTAEIGFDQPSSERRVFTLDGITQGLGLDAADAQRVQQLVNDTSASFDSKSYPKLTQAIAKITMALRRSWHIPSATRAEIAKRVRSYYQNTQVTDYGAKAPSIRYTPSGVAEKTTEQPMRKANPRLVIKAAPDMMRPPQGFMPVPKSKKGGWKSPDGKAYWYPDGKGVRSSPEEGGGAAAGGAQDEDAPVHMGVYEGKGIPAPGGGSKFGQGSKVTAPGAQPSPGGAAGPKGQQGAAPGAGGPSAGAQGGGRHEQSHAFSFAAAPKGSAHDATELHHRAELTKVKHLLKQARQAGDQEAVQKLMAIGKQHQDAGNAAIRAGAEAFAQGGPSQVGQGQQPSQAAPEGGEEEAPEAEGQPTEQAPQNGSQGQPAPSSGVMQGGDEGESGLPGEKELASDPRKGLARTSSGVTTDEHGNRVTAASSKPRAIPEAAIVGEMRQRLGRAVNVMSDLSAAHDDLATQKQSLSKWKASGHPATKQAVATIRAQIAQTQADIAQLEAAHGEAMKDVNEAQTKMREAKIRESPIFQAFMGVMGKIGEVGGKIGAAVQDVKEGAEAKARSKEGLAATQKVLEEHIAGTDEQGNPIKQQAAGEGVSAKKKKQFGAFENPTIDPKVKQAEDVLSRLAAQDDIAPDVEELASEDVYELGEGEEELSPEERAIAQRIKANPAEVLDREASAKFQEKVAGENKRAREIVDRLEAEGRFGGPDQVIGGPNESGVRRKGENDDKATESPIARKRRLVEEQKRKAADQKGTVKLAKSRRRRVVPMSEIVKSEAWRIAIDLGMQANADLRKSYPGPRLVIITKAAPRVPYFFNDL